MNDLISDELREAILNRETLDYALLIELHFAPGTEYFWSHVGALEYAGKTWVGVGAVSAVDLHSDQRKPVNNRTTLSLFTIPGQDLSEFGAGDYQGRPAFIHLLAARRTESTFEPLGHVPRFVGGMDSLKISDTGSLVKIDLGLSDEYSRVRSKWGAKYTNEDQKRLFPDDKSLRFVNALQDVDVNWGTGGAFFRR